MLASGRTRARLSSLSYYIVDLEGITIRTRSGTEKGRRRLLEEVRGTRTGGGEDRVLTVFSFCRWNSLLIRFDRCGP